MKKLIMSLVAVAALSSSAFAGTETKETKENADAKNTTSEVAESNEEGKVADEKKESKEMLIKCVYTLNVYNGSGQVVDTYTSETYVENSCSGFFGSCRLMYRHMLANNQL